MCTAVFDALQASGAVRDDCLVDALVGIRWVAGRGVRPATTAAVVAVRPIEPAREGRPLPKRRPIGPRASFGTEDRDDR